MSNLEKFNVLRLGWMNSPVKLKENWMRCIDAELDKYLATR